MQQVRPTSMRALAVASALAMLMVMGAPATERAVAAGCANAGASAGSISLKEFRIAVTCLVNAKRAKRDLPRVRVDRDLRVMEQRHTKVMLETDCLAHECPGEPSFGERLNRCPYTQGNGPWQAGEMYGYAETPRALVAYFLSIGSFRSFIFKPAFRDIGVGIGWGAAQEGVPDEGQATSATILACNGGCGG